MPTDTHELGFHALSADAGSAWNALEAEVTPDQSYEGPDFRVVARRLMAHRLGGDFHAAVVHDTGQILLALGAIAAEGAGAELAKLSIASGIRHSTPSAPLGRTMRDVFRRPLRELGLETGGSGREGSLFCACVDRTEETLRYFRVGVCFAVALSLHHEPIPLGTPDVEALDSGTWDEQDNRVPLSHVRRVIACSDGVVNARSPGNEPFGRTRLEALIDHTLNTPLEEQVESILDAVRAHIGQDRTLTHDATVLAADFADELTLFLDRFVHNQMDWCRHAPHDAIESSVYVG